MKTYKLKGMKTAGATIVGIQKKIEDGVVGTYKKIEGKFIETFLEEEETEATDTKDMVQ